MNMRIIFLFLILMLSPNLINAQEKVFIREYTYKASEVDSKSTCRSIAINQLRAILLDELGVYIQRESTIKTSEIEQKYSQNFMESIKSQNAGIVKLTILEETWNGETFWMKASLSVDIIEFKKSLEDFRSQQHMNSELKSISTKLNEVEGDLGNLREQLVFSNAVIDSLTKRLDTPKGKNVMSKAQEFSDRANEKRLEGDYLKALDYINQAIAIEPLNASYYKRRAVLYDKLKNYGATLSDLTQAVKLDSDNPERYYDMYLMFSFLEDYEKALIELDKAIKLAPSKPLTEKIYLAKGKAYGELNLINKAIESYSFVVTLNPQSSVAYLKRGILNCNNSNYLDGIKDFSSFIDLNPNKSNGYFNRGWAKDAIHDYKGALEDFTACIQIDPEDASCFYNRGCMKTKLFDYSGSILDYTQAIRLEQNDEKIYFNRAQSYKFMFNYNLALADLNSAININPDYILAYFERGLTKIALKDKKGGCVDISIAGSRGYEPAQSYYKQFCN